MFLSSFTKFHRVVIFSLRAVQARNESRRFSNGLVTYLQISFGLGFVGIANDAVKLTRCLLVNATYGLEKYPQSPAASTKGGLVPPPTADTPDQPRVRFWCRRAGGFMDLAFLAATVPGIIASSHYSNVFNNQNNANTSARDRLVVSFFLGWISKLTVMGCSIVSSAVTVGLSCIMLFMNFWGHLKLPRVSKRGSAILVSIYTLVVSSAFTKIH